MDLFDEKNGMHRIAYEYIEINKKNINYIYEYSIKRDSLINEEEVNLFAKDKADKLRAKYKVIRYAQVYKVKFYQPISYMSFVKESLFGNKDIIHSNYMTEQEAQIYGFKRQKQLEKQQEKTRKQDEEFKKKMKRFQSYN